MIASLAAPEQPGGEHGGLRPQILAAFLVLTGIGLRIEAAIVGRRP
ncbi:hypothetical protein [Micromonospora lupini]